MPNRRTRRAPDRSRAAPRSHAATRLARSLAPFALGAALVPVAAPATRQGGAYEEIVRVLEVQVPVHAVDRGGHPIRGLTADDFEVLEGRKKRPIVGFDVIDLERLAPGRTRSELDRALPAAARRHFLLLFDLAFSQPGSLLRARTAARELVLERLHPTDLVAVATHSVEKGGRLLVTFTPDRAQVARAIDTLGAPALLDLRWRDPLSFLIDVPGAAARDPARGSSSRGETKAIEEFQKGDPDLTFWVLGQEMKKAERSQSLGRVSAWSASLAQLAGNLRSAHGRKHVLLFSEGFDGELLFGREELATSSTGLLQDERNQISQRHWSSHTDTRFGSTGLQRDIGRLLEVFRQADCVIEAIDIAMQSARGEGGSRRARQHALFYLASETGGELFGGAGALGDQLSDVLEGTSLTYLLTISANDVPADGSYRKLKVKARLPRGGRLSARPGYFAPRPYAELDPVEKNLLASEAIASAISLPDIPIQVLAAPFRASEALAYVPVIIEVAGAPLVAGQPGAETAIEFYGYVTDERGEMRDFFSQRLRLEAPASRWRRAGVKYYGHLDLEPGEYLIRALVRNAGTGRFGLETLSLSIPVYALGRPVLLPPFFVEDGSQWLLVREDSEGLDPSVVYPFTVSGEVYVPAALATLRRDREARLCLVAYNLPDGEIEAHARVLAPDGTAVDGGRFELLARTVTGTRGFDKLLASFQPRDLDGGRYTLQVTLSGPGDGSKVVSSVPFLVASRSDLANP